MQLFLPLNARKIFLNKWSPNDCKFICYDMSIKGKRAFSSSREYNSTLRRKKPCMHKIYVHCLDTKLPFKGQLMKNIHFIKSMPHCVFSRKYMPLVIMVASKVSFNLMETTTDCFPT